MKKLLLVLGAVLVSSFSCVYAGGIPENSQVVYMPSTKTWVEGGMAEDRIVLTRKVSTGTGSYSGYYYFDGSPAFMLHSNYEFLKNSMLISVDNASLKYYKVIYKDYDVELLNKMPALKYLRLPQKSKFVSIPLSDDELKQVFGKPEIIRISQFENSKLNFKKGLFREKTVLLLNDTDNYYHKFSVKPSNVQKSDVKGLLTISKRGEIEFSHYGEEKDKLIINVK